MKLIVDSGSTKAVWALITPDGKISGKLTTEGLNPQYITEHDIQPTMHDLRCQFLKGEDISALYFYGAGCVSPEHNNRFAATLGSMLGIEHVTVESDLLGAARALFGNSEGIACILGTGSNSAYYNGRTLTAGAYAGGFILGDEGSGAVLGRHLISDWIKQTMPADIHRQLTEEYTLTYPEIVNRVYRQPYPNRYLAQFARFIGRHTDHPYISSLLKSEFDSFFARNLSHCDKHLPVGFVGSIAHYFADQLREAATAAGFTISGIQKTPISALAKYHGETKLL